MRPLRFVALAEDGQSLILTDEAGRMLYLTLDDAVISAIRQERGLANKLAIEVEASLTPRDIQARIRAGDSVAEVARVANVPVEKVLRFAGPVLQERAATVELAQRSCSTSTPGELFGTLATTRLTEHGVDPQTVVWDAYRRDNGGWRISASWQSGRATAHALWDLDKQRLYVKPVDDMAHFLCDPPLSEDEETVTEEERQRSVQGGRVRGRPHVAASRMFRDDHDTDIQERPVVPAVSMLRREVDSLQHSASARPAEPIRETSREPEQQRPKRSVIGGKSAAAALGLTPTKRTAPGGSLPSWDDILFGSRGE
ncbi:MAG TPA: septation protein SepH [Mycobacteriales bacterium]|nr:septation protein SepH [Mycobacteriales bacterium]